MKIKGVNICTELKIMLGTCFTQLCYYYDLLFHWNTFNYFKIFYLFIFRERGRVGERQGEKHQCVVASLMPPTGDLARNPGKCPHWESNWRPFDSQASAQATEPHQPGQNTCNYFYFIHERLMQWINL